MTVFNLESEFREQDNYLEMIALSNKLHSGDFFKKIDSGLVESLSPKIVRLALEQMIAKLSAKPAKSASATKEDEASKRDIKLGKSKEFSFESYSYKVKATTLTN